MWAIEHVLEPCMLLFISNVCLKYAPKWMVSSSIFQKFSGEGLTEPPPQTPPPVFSRASPSVRASPSILRRFAPSNRASPSILGRFAPSIRASPSTFGWKLGLAPPKINSWIRHWIEWSCRPNYKWWLNYEWSRDFSNYTRSRKLCNGV